MFILDKNSLIIKSGSQSSFCQKHFNESKCKNHYESFKNGPDDIKTCPFGYCSVKTKQSIISGLKIKDYYSSKKVNADARESDSSPVVSVDFVNSFIKQINELETELLNKDVYRQTIHDLKRANSFFSDLLDEALENPVYQKDQSLRDLLDAFALIGTRLDYHDFILGRQGNSLQPNQRINLIKIGVKLSKMLQYKAISKKIKINNSNNCSFDPCILADSKLIYILFFVLLENAIKYSPANETIYVDYDSFDKNTISVSFKNKVDTPLSETDVQNIFNIGYRGSNSLSVDGTGTGMSVVKNIIDLYNFGFKMPIPNKANYIFTIYFPKYKNS